MVITDPQNDCHKQSLREEHMTAEEQELFERIFVEAHKDDFCECCGEWLFYDHNEAWQDAEFAPVGAKRAHKHKMPCNKPRRSRSGQKTHVVRACQGGKSKLVRFGHTMKNRKGNKKARKSFRARHKCGSKKSKLSAGYWSCKAW